MVVPRLRDEPAAVLLRLEALLPRPLVSRVVGRLARTGRSAPRGPLVIAVVAGARWTVGDRRGVLDLVASVADRPVPDRLPLASVLLAVDRPAAAQRLLGDVGAGPAEALRLLAVAEERQGRLTRALTAAERAVAAAPRSATMRATRDRIAGALRVRRRGWLPVRAVRVGRVDAARPGRVLHLLTDSLPHYQAGYTLRSQRIASAQRRAGVDALCVTRPGFPGNHGFLGATGVDVVDGVPYGRVLPDQPATLPEDQRLEAGARVVTALVTRLRPAVLQPTSSYANGLIALGVRERTATPVVYEVRGFLEETWRSLREQPDEEVERYLLDRARETEVMLAADAVVTLGQAMKDDIVARGVHADRVTVVPNGVDVDRFRPVASDPALRAGLGIEQGDTVLGYVSSLTDYEGVHHLVDAAALLRRDGRRVAVLVVGDGPARGGLEERARQRGVADHVVFTGRVPAADVLGYYGLIDVFVTPRTTARVCQLVTPLKPFEAMAAGRALVVSGLPALCEIIDEGRTGLSFTPEDAESLAAVCATLVDDPDRRAALGAAAREWVVAHRTWDHVVARYRNVYASIRSG